LAEGRSAFDASQNALARQDYERAIALAPDCAPAWAGIAHAHALDGLLDFDLDYEAAMDRALTVAREACWIGPLDGKGARILAHVLSLRGEATAALDAFDRAEPLAAGNADFHVMRSMAQALAGRAEAADTSRRAGAALSPELPGWHARHAGLVAYHRGAYAETVAWIAPVVARVGASPRARLPLAAALARLGRREEAERALAPALTSDSPPLLPANAPTALGTTAAGAR
jgi:tetratricopeptide (TPR) repeat protein